MADNESNMPFIRNLASSDRKIRTSALESLRTFLSAAATSSRLTHLDTLKLWKGLYYSLWMCDRPIPQQNLCAELAALIDVLPDEAVPDWLASFWEIIGREWTSIDVLRLEKFLLLVRRVFGAALAWAGSSEKKKGAAARVDALVKNLAEWPFDSSDDLSRVPVGIRLHVLDIWIDEVEKLGLLDAKKTKKEGRALVEKLVAVVQTQTKSTCKPVKMRAKESVRDERLPGNADAEEGAKPTKTSGDKDAWGGFDD